MPPKKVDEDPKPSGEGSTSELPENVTEEITQAVSKLMITNTKKEGLKDLFSRITLAFWHYQNILIPAINQVWPHAERKQTLAVHFTRPYFYAIKVPKIKAENGDTIWVALKVGFTHQENSKDRAKQVIREINKAIEDESDNAEGIDDNEAGLVFCVPQSPLDPESIREREKKVREHAGRPIPKEVLRELKLPFVTEWVMAPENHVVALMKKAAPDADARVFKGEYKGDLPRDGFIIDGKPFKWE